MATYDLLERAINEKRQIRASYKGHYREMCPHVLGYGKNGRMNCLLYQFGGESSSRKIIPGSPQNWRCVDIELFENVEVVEGEWFTADNHSSEQTCVNEVLVVVDYD